MVIFIEFDVYVVCINFYVKVMTMNKRKLCNVGVCIIGIYISG